MYQIFNVFDSYFVSLKINRNKVKKTAKKRAKPVYECYVSRALAKLCTLSGTFIVVPKGHWIRKIFQDIRPLTVYSIHIRILLFDIFS